MNLRTPIVVFLLAIILISCKNDKQVNIFDNLIPKPVSANPSGTTFELTKVAEIFLSGQSEELKRIGEYLADKLKPATGFSLKVSSSEGAVKPGNIYLGISANNELGNEGYELTITKETVKLTANKPAGLFYGIQTIRQLLPAAIE